MDRQYAQPADIATEVGDEVDSDLIAAVRREAELEPLIDREQTRFLARKVAKQRIAEEEARLEFREPELFENFDALDRAVTGEAEPMLIGGGLVGIGDLVTITGKAKQGKTTALMNLAQCLADGEPFLDDDRFAIDRPYRVLVLDGEMPRDTWVFRFRPLGLKHRGNLQLLPFRGYTLDLCTDFGANYVAQKLTEFGAEVLMIDNFAKFSASVKSTNDDVEINRFFANVQAVQEQAALQAVVLVHHAGHQGGRARGSSAFRDRPDVLWDMVKTDPPEFAVEGRHARAFRVRTVWDEDTNKLSYRRANRPEVAADQVASLRQRILTEVLRDPGASLSRIVRRISNSRHQEIKAAVQSLEASGALRVERVQRAMYLHPSAIGGGAE